MRKRGTKTVTSTKENVLVSPDTDTKKDDDAFFVIPSLDVFSRFQSKRDDFEPNWVMMDEETAAGADDATAPQILNAVVNATAKKLKAHMERFGKRRTEETADRAHAASADDDDVTDGGRSDASEALDDSDYAPDDMGAEPSATPPPPSTAEEAEKAEVVDGIEGDYLNFLEKDAQARSLVHNLGDTPIRTFTEEDEKGILLDYFLTAPSATGGGGAPAVQYYAPLWARRRLERLRQEADGAAPPAAVFPFRPADAPRAGAPRCIQYPYNYYQNPTLALHEELLDCVNDYLAPQPEELVVRRYVILKVQRLIQSLFYQKKASSALASAASSEAEEAEDGPPGLPAGAQEVEVRCYGSNDTNLLLTTSDIDLTLCHRAPLFLKRRPGAPVGVDDALQAIAREVAACGFCEDVFPQLILRTRVPLIKFQHKYSLLAVDISINSYDGLSNSAIVKRFLYGEPLTPAAAPLLPGAPMYPEARVLILFLKYYLDARGLHEPFTGGLGSYALTLMVFSFLQQHQFLTEEEAYVQSSGGLPATGKNSTTTTNSNASNSNLGLLLVNFFRYYGMYFNYNKYGISVCNAANSRNHRAYFRRTDGGGHSNASSPVSMGSPTGGGPGFAAQVYIEDPASPPEAPNNAASSLRLFHIIASLFSFSYCALT
ncbi:DNA polymerase sigma subunit, partial [Strigomonas culicis]